MRRFLPLSSFIKGSFTTDALLRLKPSELEALASTRAHEDGRTRGKGTPHSRVILYKESQNSPFASSYEYIYYALPRSTALAYVGVLSARALLGASLMSDRALLGKKGAHALDELKYAPLPPLLKEPPNRLSNTTYAQGFEIGASYAGYNEIASAIASSRRGLDIASSLEGGAFETAAKSALDALDSDASLADSTKEISTKEIEEFCIKGGFYLIAPSILSSTSVKELSNSLVQRCHSYAFLSLDRDRVDVAIFRAHALVYLGALEIEGFIEAFEGIIEGDALILRQVFYIAIDRARSEAFDTLLCCLERLEGNKSGFHSTAKADFDESVESNFYSTNKSSFDKTIESGFDKTTKPAFGETFESGFDKEIESVFDKTAKSSFDKEIESTFDKSTRPATDKEYSSPSSTLYGEVVLTPCPMRYNLTPLSYKELVREYHYVNLSALPKLPLLSRFCKSLGASLLVSLLASALIYGYYEYKKASLASLDRQNNALLTSIASKKRAIGAQSHAGLKDEINTLASAIEAKEEELADLLASIAKRQTVYDALLGHIAELRRASDLDSLREVLINGKMIGVKEVAKKEIDGADGAKEMRLINIEPLGTRDAKTDSTDGTDTKLDDIDAKLDKIDIKIDG